MSFLVKGNNKYWLVAALVVVLVAPYIYTNFVFHDMFSPKTTDLTKLVYEDNRRWYDDTSWEIDLGVGMGKLDENLSQIATVDALDGEQLNLTKYNVEGSVELQNGTTVGGFSSLGVQTVTGSMEVEGVNFTADPYWTLANNIANESDRDSVNKWFAFNSTWSQYSLNTINGLYMVEAYVSYLNYTYNGSLISPVESMSVVHSGYDNDALENASIKMSLPLGVPDADHDKNYDTFPASTLRYASFPGQISPMNAAQTGYELWPIYDAITNRTLNMTCYYNYLDPTDPSIHAAVAPSGIDVAITDNITEWWASWTVTNYSLTGQESVFFGSERDVGAFVFVSTFEAQDFDFYVGHLTTPVVDAKANYTKIMYVEPLSGATYKQEIYLEVYNGTDGQIWKSQNLTITMMNRSMCFTPGETFTHYGYVYREFQPIDILDRKLLVSKWTGKAGHGTFLFDQLNYGELEQGLFAAQGYPTIPVVTPDFTERYAVYLDADSMYECVPGLGATYSATDNTTILDRQLTDREGSFLTLPFHPTTHYENGSNYTYQVWGVDNILNKAIDVTYKGEENKFGIECYRYKTQEGNPGDSNYRGDYEHPVTGDTVDISVVVTLWVEKESGLLVADVQTVTATHPLLPNFTLYQLVLPSNDYSDAANAMINRMNWGDPAVVFWAFVACAAVIIGVDVIVTTPGRKER